MNTKEAIQAMLDGKKVIPTEWDNKYFVYFNGTHFVLKDNTQFIFGSLEYDWEIYEEPKPKETVIIEKWLCRNIKEGSHFIFDVEKGKTILYFEKVKLLDTYKVEL